MLRGSQQGVPGALAAAGFGRAPWSPVKSTVFGGNVTVAGLLLIEDYALAARKHVANGSADLVRSSFRA